MHSRLISGSRLNRLRDGGGYPSSMLYPNRSPLNPSFRLTGFLRTVPCTGCSPLRTVSPMISGPAHSVDGSPPSRASDATTAFCAASASSRSARYKLDFPLPFAPVITVSRSSGSTSSRSDLYPDMASVAITRPAYSQHCQASVLGSPGGNQLTQG